jgi:hypothetical protein
MNPSKIRDVISWNTPASATDIRSFFGLVRHYQRFIIGFSKITKHMTMLLGKDMKFKWTPTCEASFQELKSTIQLTIWS